MNEHGLVRRSLCVRASKAAARIGEPRSVPKSSSPLADLQRFAGNAATAALIKRSQRRLRVGSAADPAECEADRVAHDVVEHLQRSAGLADRLNDPASRPVRRMQRRSAVGGAGGPLNDSTEAALRSARTNGRRLPDGVRRQMEGAFGSGFGDVRVHVGPTADTLNHRLASHAFTIGPDIFFGNGAYAPATGRHLLAHELAHTLQQGGVAGGPRRLEGEVAIPPATGFSRRQGPAVVQRKIRKLYSKPVTDVHTAVDKAEIDDIALGLHQETGQEIVDFYADQSPFHPGTVEYLTGHSSGSALDGNDPSVVAEQIVTRMDQDGEYEIKVYACMVGSSPGFATSLQRLLSDHGKNVKVSGPSGLLYKSSSETSKDHVLQNLNRYDMSGQEHEFRRELQRHIMTELKDVLPSLDEAGLDRVARAFDGTHGFSYKDLKNANENETLQRLAKNLLDARRLKPVERTSRLATLASCFEGSSLINPTTDLQRLYKQLEEAAGIGDKTKRAEQNKKLNSEITRVLDGLSVLVDGVDNRAEIIVKLEKAFPGRQELPKERSLTLQKHLKDVEGSRHPLTEEQVQRIAAASGSEDTYKVLLEKWAPSWWQRKFKQIMSTTPTTVEAAGQQPWQTYPQALSLPPQRGNAQSTGPTGDPGQIFAAAAAGVVPIAALDELVDRFRDRNADIIESDDDW
jgi:hypothetical protein